MFDIKVIPPGGIEVSFDVKVNSQDIAKWERTNRNASFGGLVNNPRMDDLYKLAFFAATRLRLLPDDVSGPDFAKTWEIQVDMASGWSEPDPTN